MSLFRLQVTTYAEEERSVQRNRKDLVVLMYLFLFCALMLSFVPKGLGLQVSRLRTQALLTKAIENSLIGEGGYDHVIGCDEAGRGPLAGPVVVASLICKPGHVFLEAQDSKKLSAAKREILYDQIVSMPDAFAFHIAVVPPAVIDEINILQATLFGMQQAVEALADQLGGKSYAIIDGNKTPPRLRIPARPLVKGDSICYSVALASILAKVHRDRLMLQYHSSYPQWQFDKHKGYGTKEHIKLIHMHGASPIHRMSFKPLLGRQSDVTNKLVGK